MARATKVSNADRIVYPEVGRTKGDVVAYYDRVCERMLAHVVGRPLSIRRYPKGLAGAGFFQKNVPRHYPESIERFAVPRSREASKKHERKGKGKGKESAAPDVTLYPVVREAEHIGYVANQGAIELHVSTAQVEHFHEPDRLVIDLDPPPGALARVRRAAHVVREALGELGLDSVPVATGSKGYHVVAAIAPTVPYDTMTLAMQQLATLLTAEHPDDLTTAFRIAQRGERVFVDWLRNRPIATVIAPYSLRARPMASVAVPLAWDEVDHIAPDGFTLDDVERLVDRPDTLADLAETPADPEPFVAAVAAKLEASGIEVEAFDRFRS